MKNDGIIEKSTMPSVGELSFKPFHNTCVCDGEVPRNDAVAMGPASVRFDEYGRVLREDVRHAVDHRFAQRQGIQVGFGGSHVRKRPFTGNRYLLQLHEPFRGLALKRAGPDGGKCHAEYERGSVHVFPQFNALFWLKAIRS